MPSLVVLLALLWSAACPAATITVTSPFDSGAGTLRQAILDAAVSGDTIVFAAGVTTVTLTTAELLVDKNVTISGPGPDKLTVQRASATRFRIFRVTQNATISGMTITGGCPANYPGGGGIYNGGALAVTNCTISGNVQDNWGNSGGGIANFGTMTVTNTTISGNGLPGNPGGGIYAGSKNTTITNCTISGNHGSGILGGVDGSGVISNSTISGNGDVSNSGAGIVGSWVVTKCMISGNLSGGIDGHDMTITNCMISGNSKTNGYGGGGISVDYPGNVTITNSTISGNSVSGRNGVTGGVTGGGIYFSANATVANCTISGNSVVGNSNGSGYGGGISAMDNGSRTLNVTITNSTVTGNSAIAGSYPSPSAGGGIYIGSYSSLTARATIIALNTAPSGPDVYSDYSATLTSQGFNLIGNNTGATITPAQASDKIGTSAAPIDPLLGPLQNNGGPTSTCALLAGSPAIEAGDDSVLNTPLSLTTDQRGAGFTRRSGSHVDIGAFETVFQPVITTSAAPLGAGSTSGGGTFANGASVTVQATPAPGYNFVNWTEAGNPVSSTANFIFTANGNRTLVANFILTASNANLSSLVPGAGVLSPTFASSTTSYAISLGKTALTFKLTPFVAQAGATVKVNGTAVGSGSASSPVALSIGANLFNTVVTAPDGVTTKTYALTVTRSTQSSGADMNNDGTADLVFQNNAGQIAAWYMNGSGSAASSATLYSGGLGDWRLVSKADLNGDGNADLLFQNNAGQIAVWYMNGSGSITTAATLYGSGLGDWRVKCAVDINGDGVPDLVFQNNIGQIAVWYLNASAAATSSALLYNGGLGDWRVAGAADLNGDGTPDLLFQSNVGQLAVWYLNAAGATIGTAMLYSGGLGDWRVMAIADMNNDGNADLVFQNNIGQIAVWYLNGSGGVTSSSILYGSGLGDWRVR